MIPAFGQDGGNRNCFFWGEGRGVVMQMPDLTCDCLGIYFIDGYLQ